MLAKRLDHRRQASAPDPSTRTHTILDPKVNVNLVQDVPHAHRRSIGEEDKAQI